MENNKLQLPAVCAVLNESEKSCVEGGGILSKVFYKFGSKNTEWRCGNVYLDEEPNSSSHGFSSLGNFFDGLGRLFRVFYL